MDDWVIMRGTGGCVPWVEKVRPKVRARAKEKVMGEKVERGLMEKVKGRVREVGQVEEARRVKVKERGRDREVDAGTAEVTIIVTNAPRPNKVPHSHQQEEEEEDRRISSGGYQR